MEGDIKQAVHSFPVESGSATFTQPGQSESGDKFIIKAFDGGVLIAVIDGLGHGDEAATAAKKAMAFLQTHAVEPVIPLIKSCHEELKGTRGVVLSLASLNTRHETLTWLGVGNVAAVLMRADPEATPHKEHVLMRGGVVGYQLPPLLASVLPISRGDTLVFASDGISEGFTNNINISETPQAIAEKIRSQHVKGNDDALVLVARYTGHRS